jgi:hypothetical protein
MSEFPVSLRYEPSDPPAPNYLLPNAMLSDPESLRSWMARAVRIKPTARKPRKKPTEEQMSVVSASSIYPRPTWLNPLVLYRCVRACLYRLRPELLLHDDR